MSNNMMNETTNKKYKFKLRKVTEVQNVTSYSVKVIDKMNYVVHTELTFDMFGRLKAFTCDGSSIECGRVFCEHCKAAAEYIEQTEGIRLILTDETPKKNEPVSMPKKDLPLKSFYSADDLAKLIEESESKNLEEKKVSEIAPDDFVYKLTKDDERSDTPAENDEYRLETKEDVENFFQDIRSQFDNINPDPFEDHEKDTYSGSNKYSDTEETDNVTDDAKDKFGQKEDGDSSPFEPAEMSILLGTETETDSPLYLYPNNTALMLHNNMGIIGTMGTGKTQMIKSIVTQFRINQDMNYDGSPLGWMIFDYKGDYNHTKPEFVHATGALVTKAYRIKYNPFALSLQRNSVPLLPLHTANGFTDTISRIYNLGPKQSMLLCDCIMAAYEQRGIHKADESTWHRSPPTFSDVYRIYENTRPSSVNDSLTAVMNKLDSFEIFESDDRKTVPFVELMDKVIVFDLSAYDEDIQNLVIAITLDKFYATMQSLGSSKTDGKLRQLRNFILVDEADNFMKKGFPSLKKIMKEGREFGVGVILSTQSLAHFAGSADDYSRYILTWIVHNVSDLNRSDVEFILKQPKKSQQSEDIFFAVKGLQKHHSIVKIANSQPTVIKDKPFWELYQELNG